MQPTYAPVTLAVTTTPTTTDVVGQVSRTLRDAARYLGRYGWIQGSYYDPAATVFTPAACLVGALGMVCYGGPVDAPALNHDDPGFGDFEAARDWLDGYLASSDDGECSYSFNDAHGRTEADVILTLDEAAAAWDRRYAPNGAQGHSTVEVTR